VLVLTVGFSVTGIPAPGGVAHGAGDASGEPGALNPTTPVDPGVHNAPWQTASKRRAVAEQDLCRHGPRGIEPAAVVYHGPRDVKEVALTFDDGWGGPTLRRLLRVLQDKHVNATFFPVGQAVRHDPSTWQKVADADYPIANHTYAHATLKKQCYLEQRRELSRARSTYHRVIGVSSLPAMRPPGGLFDDATLAASTAAGETTIVLWDVDTHDWTGIGTRQVRRNALAGTKGSIVVLHTSSKSTVRALPAIIRGYRKRGFELVTVGQMLGIEGPVPYPDAADAPPDGDEG
jgi:peptidoglycan/xylan/chitin deacetylase (PgdA/CDA1 family)